MTLAFSWSPPPAAARTRAPNRDAADLDTMIRDLYAEHYQRLVRLSAMLIRDLSTAEEVVQDAFVRLHVAWARLRDPERATAYLRQSVINGSRSVLRHRVIAERYLQAAEPDVPGAEQPVLTLLERDAVVSALRTLPARQREAIVLRYYADLSEGDAAAAMGISRGALKSHTFRAMTALRKTLAPAA